MQSLTKKEFIPTTKRMSENILPNEKYSDGKISFVDTLKSYGYYSIHKVETGPYKDQYIALNRFMYTVGLLVGINDIGYVKRFCYEHNIDAMAGIQEILSGKEPTGWIKVK